MRQRYDRQIRLFGKHTSRRLFNIAPATPLPKGRGLGWLFVVVFVLSSCTGGRYDTLLCQADSLMTANPDSAWALLSAVDSVDMQHQRRSTRMRYELLRAEAQNKLYIDFTTDSVMRQVVQYYDRRGSRNERLKAHYLLGCCYRDMHEAPVALLTWEDAVACADTTAADCDYATLFRVYGQMASIYFRQYMPEKELAAREKICHYALLAGDTLNYIRGLLKRNDAYLTLGDTTTVFENIEHVRQLYLERGLTQQAAQVYPSAIQLALIKHQFERADSMMQVFERESGLFDEQGNIVHSREKYYYFKGQYYLGIGKTDSAEYQFRRLLKYDIVLIDAYRGFVCLYEQIHNADSTFKYARLYENALEYYLDDTHTNAITQSKSMYDYSRQQLIAQKQKQKTNNLKLAFIAITAGGIIFALVVFFTFQKKREEKRKLLDIYQSTIDELNKARRETSLLQQSLSQKEATQRLLKEKEKQVHDLEAVVKKLKQQIGKSVGLMLQQKIEEADIVKRFRFISKPHFELKGDVKKMIPARVATNREWHTMMETIQSCHPDLYLFVQKSHLSDLNCKVCVLSYLGFDTLTIATLTGAKKGSVSNARIALAKQLFNLRSARDLNKYLREI